MRVKTRRLLNASGSRPCEVCGRPTVLNGHHLRGRKVPKYNQPANVACLCGTCHDEIHCGEIVVEGRLMTTSGMQLFWHRRGEESFSGREEIPPIVERGGKP